MTALPRMRTAEGVLKELKAIDPGTEITLHFIRGLILSGKIPVVCAGAKKLVNLDLVFSYLQGGEDVHKQTPISYGKIRQVVV